MIAPTSSSQRLDYLDSIRGLAALAVLIGHYFGGYGQFSFIPDVLWNTPLSMVHDGFAAVAMFFVLSGLVLSLKYFRSPPPFANGWKDMGSFFILRLARILLPFLAVLWLSALLQKWFFKAYLTTPSKSAWLAAYWQSEQTIPNLLKQSFLFLPMGYDRLLPQDWTLTVEMNLSLLMPFLILIATHSLGGLIFLALVAIGLLHVHGFLLAFVMGIAIAANFSQIKKSAFLQKKRVGAVWLIMGLLLYSYRYSRFLLPDILMPTFKESWIWYVNELGAALILVAFIASERLQTYLHWRPLVFLGRISYSFYLWHFAVLVCFTPLFLFLLNKCGFAHAPLNGVLGLMGTIGMTILVSAFSYRLIEMPSMRLGKRLSGRLFRP